MWQSTNLRICCLVLQYLPGKGLRLLKYTNVLTGWSVAMTSVLWLNLLFCFSFPSWQFNTFCSNTTALFPFYGVQWCGQTKWWGSVQCFEISCYTPQKWGEWALLQAPHLWNTYILKLKIFHMSSYIIVNFWCSDVLISLTNSYKRSVLFCTHFFFCFCWNTLLMKIFLPPSISRNYFHLLAWKVAKFSFPFFTYLILKWQLSQSEEKRKDFCIYSLHCCKENYAMLSHWENW